jgi:hypothetical protein
LPIRDTEPWSLQKISAWGVMTHLKISSPEDVLFYTNNLSERYADGFVMPLRETMMKIIAAKGSNASQCPH